MSFFVSSIRPSPSPLDAVKAVICLLSLIAVGGCGKDPGLPGEAEILAKVNGSPITRYDLERSVEKSLGQFAVPSVARRMRSAALETLLQSRALAMQAEQELSNEEKRILDKEVAAYRESLLVKEYLVRHSPPRDLSEEQVVAYYREHATRFGAQQIKRYELLGTTKALGGAERVRAMQRLSQAAQQVDWSAYASELQREGIAVSLSLGDLSDTILDSKLREALTPVKEGAVSNLVFVQGRAFIGRITGIQEVPPQPLVEVRAEIEKTLRPVLLREAIQKVGERALSQAKVERLAEPSLREAEEASHASP